MSRQLSAAAVVGLALSALAGACGGDESTNPLPTEREGTAEDQRMFSPDLPEDLAAQAIPALERDAFRREARFLDAAAGGRSFRATDVRQAEIDAGLWSARTLYALGAQLFHLPITEREGLGGADRPGVSRVHAGQRGGPDARRCSACHWRGGPAGGGDGADAAYLDGDGDTQSSALARNPIALQGAGFVEILAADMTRALAETRASLTSQASKSGSSARGPLVANGISFGFLTVSPGGGVDASEVAGVDTDLVVRPFGWKGTFATIRDAAEDALRVHLGLQSDALVGAGDTAGLGPFGGADPDGDGVSHEIREGQVTALALFIAMQEVPISIAPPDPATTEALAEGQVRFGALGCGNCHTPSMPVADATFRLPNRGGGPALTIDLAQSGGEPRIRPSAQDGALRAFLFSDLRRHDMGPTLAEPRPDRGVPGSLFLTRPLWGVARSGPYLHDGRAPTLHDAILLHGGEAEGARDAYAALPDVDQGTVRVFLTSLTRAKRLVTQ